MLAGILEGGNTLWDKLPQLLLVEKWMLGLPPCLESNEKEGILAGWSCNGLEVNQSLMPHFRNTQNSVSTCEHEESLYQLT